MPATSDADDALEWSYELVQSSSLPTLDLSRSIKSRYIPPSVLVYVDHVLSRYNKLLFASYALGLCLSIAVPLLPPRASSVAALLSALLGLPLGLGSLSTLRFDVVRLLLRCYDFYFFLIVNGTTNLIVAMLFRDLRMTRLLIDWTGFQNIVLIDSQLRGIRQLSILAVVGIFTVFMLLVCIMLGRVDAIENFNMLTYENSYSQYNISATDVVGNGLITMIVLLLKIVYRKRQALRHRPPGAAKSAVIECAIYRCRVKLTPCVPAPLPRSPVLSLASPPGSAVLRSSDSLTHIHSKRPPAPAAVRTRRPSFVQQMRYIKCDRVFDARRTLLFPMRVTSKAPFPSALLGVIYTCGTGGFLLMVLAAVAAPPSSSSSSLPSRTAAAAATTASTTDTSIQHQLAVAYTLQHSGAVAAFALSIAFVATFTAALQRELLWSLCTSFDFVFYALQLASIHVSLCHLYQWNLYRCLSVATSYLWIQCVLTLDALTPLMKAKLQFHIRFAIPVVAMFVLWHVTTLYAILGNNGPADRVVWSGDIWHRHIVVRVVPFYFARLVTLTLWCCRLVNRLARATNDDAVVLRGAVAYDNYLVLGTRRRSRGKSLTPSRAIARSNQVAPTTTAAATTRDDVASGPAL